MAKKAPTKLDLEAALKDLETIVERLEQGDISLEESLKDFERGIQLTRACQQSLKEAEQRIQILVEKNDQAELQSFESDD